MDGSRARESRRRGSTGGSLLCGVPHSACGYLVRRLIPPEFPHKMYTVNPLHKPPEMLQIASAPKQTAVCTFFRTPRESQEILMLRHGCVCDS